MSSYFAATSSLDSMEPAPVTASKPASEAMIAELKVKCINTINNKLATFPVY
jgi:hypothetical protein